MCVPVAVVAGAPCFVLAVLAETPQSTSLSFALVNCHSHSHFQLISGTSEVVVASLLTALLPAVDSGLFALVELIRIQRRVPQYGWTTQTDLQPVNAFVCALYCVVLPNVTRCGPQHDSILFNTGSACLAVTGPTTVAVVILQASCYALSICGFANANELIRISTKF